MTKPLVQAQPVDDKENVSKSQSSVNEALASELETQPSLEDFQKALIQS